MRSVHPCPPRTAVRSAIPALVAALLASCAPDASPPAASRSSGGTDGPVPTQDSVVRPPPPAEPAQEPYDTTNYLAATAGADPDSVVRGRLPGSAVLDSARLGSRTQALLVRLGPERAPRDGYFRVYVVETGAADRRARATELEALGTVPPGGTGFGAADADGDGRREPYLADWTGGSGGFTVTLQLLDSRARLPYQYELFGAWADLEGREGERMDGQDAPPRVERWVAAHAARVADEVDPGARDTVVLRYRAAEGQWRRDHPQGAVGRPLRVRWHAGRVPAPWARCTTRDGDLEWVMAGDVWGYDPRRDRHFLLYDFSRYDDPHTLVLGARYVWLGVTAPAAGGHGLLAYDRSARRMEVIAVPELGRRLRVSCGNEALCSGPWLSVRDGHLFGDSVRLTLPGAVPTTEFADTGRVCPVRE